MDVGPTWWVLKMQVVRLIKILLDIASWVFIGTMIALALFTLSSNGSIIRGYRSFLVLSGSMEPSIGIGSIIVVGSQDQYRLQDVITFVTEGRTVTHRIAGMKTVSGRVTYVTKGDANRSEDEGEVGQEEVVGKVVLVIPLIGRYVAFAQSPLGLVLLVLLPGLGLIVDHLLGWQNATHKN